MKPHPLRRLIAWTIGLCKLLLASSAARRADAADRLDHLANRVLYPLRRIDRPTTDRERDTSS